VISGRYPIRINCSGASLAALALAWSVRLTPAMAKYEETPVPRGTSRRWEVLLSDEEVQPRAARLRGRTALDVRAEHRVLAGFSDADLAAMPLLSEGERLVRRAWYLDLHDPARADFIADGDAVAIPGQHVIAREEVSPELWVGLLRACDGVLGRRPARAPAPPAV
jgi:hypothetical protein